MSGQMNTMEIGMSTFLHANAGNGRSRNDEADSREPGMGGTSHYRDELQHDEGYGSVSCRRREWISSQTHSYPRSDPYASTMDRDLRKSTEYYSCGVA